MPSCRWGHRVPLKGTARVNFSQGRLARGAANDAARDILKELTRSRGELLASMCSLSTPADKIDSEFLNYLSLIQGFLSYSGPTSSSHPQQPTAAAAASAGSGSGDSAELEAATASAQGSAPSSSKNKDRLTSAIVFKWTDNMTGQVSTVSDMKFEMAMMQINVALWHMKHASKLALGDLENEDLQKSIYKSLQAAAGMFASLEQRKQGLPYFPNSDLDERIITVQRIQCLAEAQEVTVERARQKQHKPELIAGLAKDTFDRFAEAAAMLSSIDRSMNAAFEMYLQFKQTFYDAYALTYTGMHLFTLEKCGESVKALQQAKALLAKAALQAKAYKSHPIRNRLRYATSCEFDAREHRIFKNLEHDIATALDKSERENGFIYFHKIPVEEIQPLPGKGLAHATPYELPARAAQWADAEFNPAKVPLKGEEASADKAAQDDSPVTENPDEDARKPTASNEAFCVVS